MNKQQFGSQFVSQIQDVPVKDDNRVRTDFFCIVCNSIFVLLLFIISIAVYNNQSLIKMSLPNDSMGNICGYDQTNDFTILYYPDINDPLKRVCVNECPKIGAKSVGCYQNQKISCASLLPVRTNTEFERSKNICYNFNKQIDRLGLFCFPTNQQQKDLLLEKIGLSKRYHFMGVYDAMWRSFYISAIFAIAYVVLVQFFPLKAVPWTIVLGGVVSLIFGLVIMILSTGSFFLRFIFFLITVGLSLACAYTLYKPQRMRQIFICARLIKISTQILQQNLLTIVYIPIFIVFLFILLLLVGFQTLAAWSFSYFVFSEDYPFYSLSGFGSGFLQFLIVIEFLWGLAFLKQAYNFCVSGVATQWYYYSRNRKSQIDIFRSFKNLFKYHWGSVLGCGLLTFTCYIFDYAVDFFMNSDSVSTRKQVKQYDSLMQQKLYYSDRRPFDFLNLCRSQTMSYINLISIPYCNAARYCQQLSSSSSFYDYSQSTNRTYRLSAHILIITIVIFISLLTVKSYSGSSDIVGVLYIGVVSLFTVTFFLGLHADLAEGLLISTFIEEAFNYDNTGRQEVRIPEKEMIELHKDDLEEKYNNKDIMELLLDFEN